MKKAILICFAVLSTLFAFAQVPTNDDCVSATQLTLPLCPNPTVYTNVNATASVIGSDNIPDCFNGGTVQNDVWFTFDCPLDGSIVDVSVVLQSLGGVAGITNPQIAVYRGECLFDELAFLDCISAPLGDTELQLDLFGLTPGFTYFIRVNDYSASATPEWGTFNLCVQEVIINPCLTADGSTESCFGSLTDSGCDTGPYQNGENFTYTICPQDFHQCMTISVQNYNLEACCDDLNIFAGDNTSAPQIANLFGAGTNFEIQSFSECITIQFTSDGSVTGDGFELSWACSPDSCDIPPPTTCDNPDIISSMPFVADDLTNCYDYNSMTGSPCNNDAFLAGVDHVFAYTSPGDECISVTITGVSQGQGVGVFNDCPLATSCIDVESVPFGGTSATINAAFLETAGTYYIAVGNASGCGGFSIAIDTLTCPVVIPGAGFCDDALPLNGCEEGENQITVQPTDGDPAFITDVNRGCLLGPQLNYTFFYFQAGTDGDLAFTLEAANLAQDSDIDWSVWGPVANLSDLCDFAENNQPARSSWAAGADPTGLAAIHPVLGTPVTDPYDCDNTGPWPPIAPGAGGDDFCAPLPVIAGQYYIILIDDFGGAIEADGISFDLSGTTAGVLDANAGNFSITPDTAVCTGQSIQLEAFGGAAYSWAANPTLSCQNCANPIATPNGPTEYCVQIVGACADDYVCTMVDIYKLDAGPDFSVCLGDDILVDAGTNFTEAVWEWSPVSPDFSCTDCADPIIIPTIPGTTEYIATMTTTNCFLQDTIVINVLPGIAPTYSIIDNTPICIGESIAIGGPNIFGNAYFWVNQDSLPIGLNSNPTVTPTETTEYYIAIVNSTCPLPSFDSVTVQVDNYPTVNVAADITICQGESALLGQTAIQPGAAYTWTPDYFVDNLVTANPTATPELSTTYILTTSLGQCTQTDDVHVEVLPLNVVINNPQDTIRICKGTTVTLSATSTPIGTPVHWVTSNFSIDTTAASFSFVPTNSALFTAMVDNGACAREQSIMVIVDSLPTYTPISPADTLICSGSIVILQSPAYSPVDFLTMTFDWEPDIYQESPDDLYNLIVTAEESTTYVRTLVNGVCVHTDTAVVNVIPSSVLTITPVDPEICLGQTVQILVTAPGTATDYEWSGGGGLSCTNCANPVATPASTTTYTVSATIDGCDVSNTIEIVIVPSPLYQFPSDVNLCPGESTTLNVAPDPSFDFVWSGSGLNSILPDPTVSPLTTSEYFLTTTNGLCTRTDSITINVGSGILEDLGNIIVCIGNTQTLTAVGVGGNTYNWSTGEQGQVINVTPNTATDYTVTMTYGDGCTLTSVATVGVADNFALDLTAEPSAANVAQGDTITLTADVVGTGPFTYQWSANGIDLPFTTAIISLVALENPSSYSVTVISDGGCANTDTYSVTVIVPELSIPNSFTPNGDDLNDIFRFATIGANIKIQSFKVFDRWGQPVYDNIAGEWDGTYKTKQLPTEVYLFDIILLMPDGTEKHIDGDVTLLR